MKRKSRLFYIALSVFVPPLGIFLLAAVDLFYSQKNVEALARVYVEHFTENTALRLNYGRIIIASGDASYFDVPSSNSRYYIHRRMIFDQLHADLALLNYSGEFMYGAEKLRAVANQLGPEIPIGMAKEMTGPDGERFTIARYPSREGSFWIVGAISWNDMPGFTTISIYLWPILIASVSLWSAFSIWRLWRAVINPTQWLEEKI